MVVPALVIVALNVVLPYGVAFKLVAILGLVTLPVRAAGRSVGWPASATRCPNCWRWPALCFLLDESFSIYGGNVKARWRASSRSRSRCRSRCSGLGLFARGLRTGKFRSLGGDRARRWPCLSHGIVLIFVVLGAVHPVAGLDGPHPVRLRPHDRC